MVKHRHALKTEYSASQSFLLSKTKSEDSRKNLKIGEVFDHDLVVINEFDPDVHTGKAFIDHALSFVESSTIFGVLALQLDPPDDDEDSDDVQKEESSVEDVSNTIGKVCKDNSGVWGVIEKRLFGCFFAEKNEKECLNIAESIKQVLTTCSSQTVTIGIASFPSLDYEKDQILANSIKALDHATFFGRDSLVAFDAVSLNISGDRLYEKGDVEGAIAEFKKGLLIDPDDTNIHNSLGVCFGVIGNLPDALNEFKRVIEINSEESLAIYNAGLTSMLTGDRDAALEYFQQAAEQPETAFEADMQIGRLYLGENAPAEAKSHIEKAIDLRPDSFAAHSCLGECCTALGMTSAAITAYKKAVRLNANDAAALSGLGWLYNAQGKNLEIATLFCRQSVEIAPDNGLYRQRLGQLYLNEDRFQEALSEFNKATELGCDSAEFIEKVNHSMVENGD
jgi:tetratricopeptide (TPR) repeat protein